MSRSLKAALAISILSISACASDGVHDELAGETDEDAAEGGKADGAIDGAYTYFEIYKDLRKCAAPSCGGFFLHRLNRTSTVCHNGSSRWSCYVPSLDWSESQLGDDQQSNLIDAAVRDATSYGVVAIVRGRFGAQSYSGFGNLGRFIVTEAWVAENNAVSDGVFTRVHDNGVRCITTPCPTIGEKALNTSRSANVHGLDWAVAGFDDEQIGKLSTEMVASLGGIIIAGDRYTFKENNQNAKGRTVTAAYRRLVDQTCYVGGCSGQVCSDQDGVITTCEWREEYACYQSATCERQPDGQCGWTPTAELEACLAPN
jgi:eight-cysteine-cluster-containing protein